MGIFFSGKELVDIAIGIEKNGTAFYDSMIKCAREKKAQSAFKYLADQERDHIKIYQRLLASVGDAPPPESYTEEYDQYLKSLVNSAVFSSEAAACKLAESTSSDAEGIDFGIRAEKDSILFYTEIQGLVRRADATVIGKVIEEEKSHLKQLSELKTGLARSYCESAAGVRTQIEKTRKEEEMAYTAKDYGKLIGMTGFSETLLKNHFTLYQGYVTNTNKLLDTLAALLKDGKTGTPEYAELKRRLGFEFNGMRLHEYYFENLGGKTPLDKSGKLGKKLAEEFGSYENWEKDFRGTGALRGIGWAILYQDGVTGRLINQWINEHETGHLAGGTPILVMDVFEHAFMTDYGLKRADYIEAFFKNINWPAVEARLK